MAMRSDLHQPARRSILRRRTERTVLALQFAQIQRFNPGRNSMSVTTISTRPGQSTRRQFGGRLLARSQA